MAKNTTVNLNADLDVNKIREAARAYDELARAENRAAQAARSMPRDARGRFLPRGRANELFTQPRPDPNLTQAFQGDGFVIYRQRQQAAQAAQAAITQALSNGGRTAGIPPIIQPNSPFAPPVASPTLSMPKWTAPPIYRPGGPHARFRFANSRYEDALRMGGYSDDELNDLRYSRDSAAGVLRRFNGGAPPLPPPTPKAPKAPPGLRTSVMNAISSSRFGGDGIQPLIGRSSAVLEAAGLSSELAGLAGPVGIAVAATVELGKAIYSFSADAAKSGQELAMARYSLGSTGAQAARLQAYSRATGVDFVGLAQGFDQRLQSDPRAAGIAGQFGAYSVPGVPHNEAANLLKAIEGLQRITNEEQRTRVARQLGLEAALPLTQASRGSVRQLGTDANLTASIMDPQFQKDAAEFNLAAGRVQGGWQALSGELSKSFFPIITPLLNGVADTEYSLAAFMKGDFKSAADYGIKALQEFGTSKTNADIGFGGGGMNFLFNKNKPFLKGSANGDGSSGMTPEDNLAAALDANTKAQIAHTRLVKEIGGGEMSKKAIPSALRNGHFLSRESEVAALKLGAMG